VKKDFNADTSSASYLLFHKANVIMQQTKRRLLIKKRQEDFFEGKN
jgi:hypothetical protein